MLESLDRYRRDSTLFQFTTKQLRDFLDPNHLLIQIDEQLDFTKLVVPLEERYSPDFGRPAIHPEVMVRALLICSLYNIASFRRLCSAISDTVSPQAASADQRSQPWNLVVTLPTEMTFSTLPMLNNDRYGTGESSSLSGGLSHSASQPPAADCCVWQSS